MTRAGFRSRDMTMYALADGSIVKLGRRPPTRNFDSFPWVDNYLPKGLVRAAPLPESVDYYSAALDSITRIYLNDRYGDCVWASTAHQFGVWTAFSKGTPVLATDDEISKQYFGVCGRFDQGCVITEVLDYLVHTGATLNGTNHKIIGYAGVKWTDEDLLKAAILIFGCVRLGINLPADWMKSGTWDVTNSGIIGGHDVPIIGYNEKGPIIASWGRTYQMTWAAATSTRWIEEAYVSPTQDWINAQGVNPLGLPIDQLLSDMKSIQNGQIPIITPTPPVPGPTPTPPVPGPTPPGPTPTPGFNIQIIVLGLQLNALVIKALALGETREKVLAEIQTMFSVLPFPSITEANLKFDDPCAAWKPLRTEIQSGIEQLKGVPAAANIANGLQLMFNMIDSMCVSFG